MQFQWFYGLIPFNQVGGWQFDCRWIWIISNNELTNNKLRNWSIDEHRMSHFADE